MHFQTNLLQHQKGVVLHFRDVFQLYEHEKNVSNSHVNKKYKHEETHLTETITYLLGGGGTGKTTVLFKLIVFLLEIIFCRSLNQIRHSLDNWQYHTNCDKKVLEGTITGSFSQKQSTSIYFVLNTT